jgi:FdhD protein
MASALKDIEVVRVRSGRRAAEADRAAVEEPLEVRLHGRPFAVIMRTPGADRELAAGFLFSERVLRCADDLGTIEYCTDRVRAGRSAAYEHDPENIVDVTLPGRSADQVESLLALRRQTTTNSSCGMCGRQTIESLHADVPPISIAGHLRASVVSNLPGRLRRAQTVFGETGGLHAAGLFSFEGDLTASAEDVGRHNAVDKVVGRMLMADALPLAERLLFVSGRTSFEIVQKALLAGIAVVASVSAPSSLAIDLARDSGITLLGFVRGEDFNIYAHHERIRD